MERLGYDASSQKDLFGDGSLKVHAAVTPARTGKNSADMIVSRAGVYVWPDTPSARRLIEVATGLHTGGRVATSTAADAGAR